MNEKEQLLCNGCGIVLQSISKEAAGYIPETTKDRSPMICQRCFRIKHYNEVSAATPDHNQFLKILAGIGDQQALVIHIVDIFDFEGSIISGLHRFVGTNPVILLCNKVDLLPSGTNTNKLVNWVQRRAKEQGLKLAEVLFCSAKKNIGFERLLEKLELHRGNRDVYVVGATNVGKSTFINRLIRDYSDLDAELTTSLYPGTTLGIVRIPLDDGHYIMDTPGIVYESRLTEIIDKVDLKLIMPEKPMKPMIYQLNSGQTLFFGALARMDYIKGERVSFSCFLSNEISIHRTKLERADELYAEHAGDMLSPPDRSRLSQLPKFTRHPISIPRGGPADITISGLGWVKVNSDHGAQIEIHAPKGIKVTVRESLI